MAGAKLGWKLVDMAFTVAMTLLTKQALTTLWRLGSGHKPPKDPATPESNYAEVVAWAVASGASAALTKRFATARAERYWIKSTGTAPPGRDIDDD